MDKFCPKCKTLSVQAEIWYQDSFSYAEFNGGVYFFDFKLETSFVEKSGRKNKKMISLS